MIVNAEVEDFKIAQGEEIEAITEWCFKVEEQLRKLLDGPKSEHIYGKNEKEQIDFEKDCFNKVTSSQNHR
jgi:hypothetical protein